MKESDFSIHRFCNGVAFGLLAVLCLTLGMPNLINTAYVSEESKKHGIWNRYLQQLNIAECWSTSDLGIKAKFSLFSSTGVELNQQMLDFPAHSTKHIILDLITPIDSYGTYSVSVIEGDDSLNCISSIYRLIDGKPQYSYHLPMTKPLSGTTFGFYNSFNAAGSNVPVANWLSLYNVDDSPLSGKVITYDLSGAPLKVLNFEGIAPSTRRDIALGHPDGQRVGLYEIRPDNSNQLYGSYLGRFSSGPTGVESAYSLLPLAGSGVKSTLALSTMGDALNWLEIGNTSSESITVEVTFRSQGGNILALQTLTLTAHQQQHLFVNSILGARAIGKAELACVSSNCRNSTILAQSMYYGIENGRTQWAYGSQALPQSSSRNLALSYPTNTFFNSANWLKFSAPINNSSGNSTLALEFEIFDESGATLASARSPVAIIGTSDIPLHEEIGTDSIGSVAIEPLDKIFSAELIRVFYRDVSNIPKINHIALVQNANVYEQAFELVRGGNVTPPTPTPSASPSPSPTIAPTPTPSITATPTATPSLSPTPTPTVSATQTPSPTPTLSPTPTPIELIVILGADTAIGGTVTAQDANQLELPETLYRSRVNLDTNLLPTMTDVEDLSKWNISSSNFIPFVFPGSATIGFESTLAKRYAERTNKKVALLKFALGKSTLSDWSEAPQAGKKLRFILLNEIRAAVSQLREMGYRPTIAGLLIAQGEGDVEVNTSSESYSRNLRKLINLLRTKLENYFLPVIIAELDEYDSSSLAAIDRLRSVQSSIANQDFHATLLDTSTASRNGRFYDRTSYDTLGATAADELISLARRRDSSNAVRERLDSELDSLKVSPAATLSNLSTRSFVDYSGDTVQVVVRKPTEDQIITVAPDSLNRAPSEYIKQSIFSAVQQRQRSSNPTGGLKLVFPNRIYQFDNFDQTSNAGTPVVPPPTSGPHLKLHKLSNITLDFQGSTFRFAVEKAGILLSEVSRFQIKNLNIEYIFPAASLGHIVCVPSTASCDVVCDPITQRCQTDGRKEVAISNTAATAILDIPSIRDSEQDVNPLGTFLYDASTLGEYTSVAANLRYQTAADPPFLYDRARKRFQCATERMVNSILTPVSDLTCNRALLESAVGDPVMMVHRKNIGSGFSINNPLNEDITLENIWMRNISGAGIGVTSMSRGLHVRNVHFVPKNQSRFLGFTATGLFYRAGRGDIILENSEFNNSGDDHVNIHGDFWKITEVTQEIVGGQTFHVLRLASAGFGSKLPRVESVGVVGDSLQIFDLRGLPVANGEFLSATEIGNELLLKIADSSLISRSPVSTFVGKAITNLNLLPNRVYINNNTFKHTGARALLLATNHTYIGNNVASNIARSPLKITSDLATFWEGATMRNFLIERNSFSNSNFVRLSNVAEIPYHGLIAIGTDMPGADPYSDYPLASQIEIRDNVLFQGANALLQISSAEKVRVLRNTFRNAFRDSSTPTIGSATEYQSKGALSIFKSGQVELPPAGTSPNANIWEENSTPSLYFD